MNRVKVKVTDIRVNVRVTDITITKSLPNHQRLSSVVPAEYKHVMVLLKKSGLDPDDLKNFRPVSNLFCPKF